MLQLYVRGDRSNEEFVICVYVKKEKKRWREYIHYSMRMKRNFNFIIKEGRERSFVRYVQGEKENAGVFKKKMNVLQDPMEKKNVRRDKKKFNKTKKKKTSKPH